MSGRVFLPIFTAFLRPCCLDAIRAEQDDEREGMELRCACGNPLRVTDGAWCFDAGYEPSRASTRVEEEA